MEKKQNFIILFVSCVLGSLFPFHILAQPDSTSVDSAAAYISNHTDQIFQSVLVDGDTVPWAMLDEILMMPNPTFDDNEARKRYYILKRKVLKVYPYASLAGEKLDSLNYKLADISRKRKRKKNIKEYQRFLEDRFEPELKNLTRSEGQILCKLVNKETGITVYDLIKSYRSGWNAFWYNKLAHWYDIDLKTIYDPVNNPEDQLIQNILTRAFLDGSLVERVPLKW